MGKLSLLVIVLLCASCSSGESVDEYNRKQAELAEQKKPKGPAAVKVETAVRGGTKIACDKLLDAARLTEMLEEKEPVTLSDQSKQDIEATSVCSVRRGGKVMDAKAQEEMVKKTMRLGVLAGDELCNIAAYCAIPADGTLLKDKCERDQMASNDAIGVFACVKVTPKGPDNAYTYKFADPDARCVVQVRGGPSVSDEAEVRRCAKAALELIGPESLQE